MSVNWAEVRKAMYPIKDYEDLSRRWRKSFGYPFVRAAFNFTIPALVAYTRTLLGCDARGRYNNYMSMLVETFTGLHQAGVKDILDLTSQVGTRVQLKEFAERSGVSAHDIVAALKYLIYWVIPMEKPLSGLVQNNHPLSDAIKALHGAGIRTNLDLLQQAASAAGRRTLVIESGLPEAVVAEWVHRADFSRMPWASKATISNIMGAGYGSLDQLANANPEQLYEAFFRHGKAIGKNLKYGNEIENSYRIAKIVPVVLHKE